MESDESENGGVADRRAAPRKRMLQKGDVLFLDSGAAMECLVLDVSDSGARLRPADVVSCPDQFRLRGPDGGQHLCEVVWRAPPDIGVRFL